ncbi:vesicle-associated protein 2-2 [Gossypium raimondii]|uniref:MSP domain-containing protein n=5 Tax=Gossypium raimondii TaxID=29730 RepID=A0A0D2QZI7_GOSRA|nr:vesicle-associated protein 2-2 [Gossypium raimondii]KJB44573.1 hypothetical protein B456_007G264400 [Gossypium raimondii]
MNTQLLEIEPKELKFVFILKKQSSCSITLTNKTNQYVAFKVKTTSPKKYCVRPNVGIIMPKSACDFTVTMQAQREAPPDMICRDKFLIQSTVVPVGTTDEDITSATFVKDSGKYIEENKLKVALVSPPDSPVLSPINGTMNQGMDYDRVETFATLPTVLTIEESKMRNTEDLKPTKDVEWNSRKDTLYEEKLKPKKGAELKPMNDIFGDNLNIIKDTEPKPKKDAELKPMNDIFGDNLNIIKDTELKPKNNSFNSKELKPVKDEESKPMEDILDTEELKPMKEKEFNVLKDYKVKTLKTAEDLNFAKDMEEMKSKLSDLESKLGKAEATISKLTEERRLTVQERKTLQEELALLRKKIDVRRVQVGFPLLFVCMVAVVSMFMGYQMQH